MKRKGERGELAHVSNQSMCMRQSLCIIHLGKARGTSIIVDVDIS